MEKTLKINYNGKAKKIYFSGFVGCRKNRKGQIVPFISALRKKDIANLIDKNDFIVRCYDETLKDLGKNNRNVESFLELNSKYIPCEANTNVYISWKSGKIYNLK